MQVPFICIEPWTSLPGPEGRLADLERSTDYNLLQPGQSRTHHLDITILD